MHRYIVLGGGIQGTAAAYDLARFGDARSVTIADLDQEAAKRACNKVNELLGSAICVPLELDASDAAALSRAIKDQDVIVSCVPYTMQPNVMRVAAKSGVHMVDMGSDVETIDDLDEIDRNAKSSGASLVPDTGLAPGLINSLATWLMERLDKPEHVRLYCGGLPQNPKPPFNYHLAFSLDSLIGEYDDPALAIQNGRLVHLEPLTGLETIDWPDLGQLEAFVTSGGSGTAPMTFENQLKTYEYKTLRFPGCCVQMRSYRDAGLWSPKPLPKYGVSPREVFIDVIEKLLTEGTNDDQVFALAVVSGLKDGSHQSISARVHQKRDPQTGFTAMAQLTGFSSSIAAIAIAKGLVPPGFHTYETALPGRTLIEELPRRGISVVTEQLECSVTA